MRGRVHFLWRIIVSPILPLQRALIRATAQVAAFRRQSRETIPSLARIRRIRAPTPQEKNASRCYTGRGRGPVIFEITRNIRWLPRLPRALASRRVQQRIYSTRVGRDGVEEIHGCGREGRRWGRRNRRFSPGLCWVLPKPRPPGPGCPPPGGGRRGQVEEPVKSFYLTCPPPACFYLFICLAAVVHF